MLIPYINLKKQYLDEKPKLIKKIDNCLKNANFVTNFDEVSKFEKNISKICKVKYCVSLNSGTDALTFALHLLGIKKGDEVITVSNSFIATTAVIVHLGATPVFVDVKDDQNIDEDLIEGAITKKTKAILPVHLTGRVCNMIKIMQLSRKYNIPVIEDCAQSIMSKYKGKICGTYGDVGCFSAHPLKNLNAAGDSGYLVTNNKKIYKKIIDLRNHGMSNRNIIRNFGYVSRMDNLQATILNFRLSKLKRVISYRRKNFELYKKNLNKKFVYFPEEKKNEFNTYHTFVIQVEKRDRLKKFLKNKGVETSIHYPIPIHLQPAYKKKFRKKNFLKKTESQSKKILTLPINQYLKKKEIKYICKLINNFYEKK